MVIHKDDNQAVILEEALTRFVDQYLQGEKPDTDEFIRQYPQCEGQLKERIQDLREIDFLLDSLVQADDSEFDSAAVPYELVGQKLASFQVEKVIGRGGMGVVYLARDTKLDRSVAIKSLPSGLLSSSTAKARFKREAKLLASMNHPNIAVIYDIIEHDAGITYLILEHVPGETLAERITREPLKLEEALSIGQQVAEAISAAHKKGVIHRDLKPGNINITPDGRVKVLDFGLAKTSGNEGKGSETTATQPGHVMGTPAYMSPEQARGKDTNHQTDIWSFGCIMYEMLTGHLPFEGETATDTVARILEREPDWELLPNETPENIRVLLRRCLAKNQDERLGDIEDAAIEIREALNLPAARPTMPVRILGRWAIAVGLVLGIILVGLNIGRWREQLLGGTGRVESLAVLPLENLTGDPEQEIFADGLTEVLIAELGKIGALQVRSRTNSMRYKDTKKSLSEIAQELNVDAVVESAVLSPVGQRVQITINLIHAPTDTHIWSDSYERDTRDILSLIREIARTIAGQIDIPLTPEQEVLFAAKRPINPETFDTYVRGMYLLYKSTPEGTKKGLEYLQQAIENDPSDPLAYGQLALGYAAIAHGPGAPPDALEQTEKAALKALELDKTSVEAYAALGHIRLYRDWEWEAAEQTFQRALQLNPSLTLTRSHYSWYLMLMGRTDDALTQMKRVQEVDPLTPLWPAYLGTQYLWAGRYDEAIEEIQKSLELDSNFAYGLNALGSAYAAKGMYEEAIKVQQKAGEIGREWKSGLGLTYAMAGRQDEARQVLDELETDATTYDTWFIAQIHAVLGEKDEAFRWLEAGFGPPKQPYLPWTKCAPAFKSLHDDPRYDELLRRMNLLR